MCGVRRGSKDSKIIVVMDMMKQAARGRADGSFTQRHTTVQIH
jgi:hypothetical protein